MRASGCMAGCVWRGSRSDVASTLELEGERQVKPVAASLCPVDQESSIRRGQRKAARLTISGHSRAAAGPTHALRLTSFMFPIICCNSSAGRSVRIEGPIK